MSNKPPKSPKKPVVPESVIHRRNAAWAATLDLPDEEAEHMRKLMKAFYKEKEHNDRLFAMTVGEGVMFGFEPVPKKVSISQKAYFGGKTRRRRRGGAVKVWEVVRDVCSALGLRTCPLKDPTPAEMKSVVDATTVNSWGPPPESPPEEDPAFVFPDPGRPPRHPTVTRPMPESETIRREAYYLRDVAKDINKKGDRPLALKFMELAKQAYARSFEQQKAEVAEAKDKKENPLKFRGIAEKGKVGTPRGGKTRRRGKSKK